MTIKTKKMNWFRGVYTYFTVFIATNMHEVNSNIEIFTMPKPKFTKDCQPMLIHTQYYLQDKF